MYMDCQQFDGANQGWVQIHILGSNKIFKFKYKYANFLYTNMYLDSTLVLIVYGGRVEHVNNLGIMLE